MPDWKQEIRRRLSALRLEAERETEIVEEVAQHLEDRYGELISGGATEDEARSAALADIESLTSELRRTEQLIKKEPVVLGAQRGSMLEDLRQDLRYGLRMLGKNPGFTAVAVLTLALGIGANTAIFSVVNAVLLRPLPYHEAERIVAIEEYRPDGNRAQVTPANFLDWREQNQSFDQLAAYNTRSANLAGLGDPERIGLAKTSADFFDCLGVTPQLGRLFQPTDEQPGHDSVAVISHGLWQRRFGGDREMVGKTILLDGQSYTVVGVTPPGFQFPEETDAWIPPLRLAPELYPGMDVTRVRGLGFLSAIARLKPGVSVEQAHAEMEAITARLREQHPDSNSKRFDRVVSLQAHLVGGTKQALLVLLGAVLIVLLIACANVANLLLARTAARKKEMALRSALGARRARVIRQMLAESVLLASIGGACGVAMAWWGLSSLLALAPADLPRIQEVTLDGRVLAVALGLSLLTGVAFGLVPAFQFARQDIYTTLKENPSGAEGAHRSRLRGMLVVTEIALSLVLLAGAGLLLKSFQKLQAIEPGFDAQEVLTMRITPAGESYDTVEQVRRFYDQVLERISSLAGVEAAGAVSVLPLGRGAVAGFQIEGRPPLLPSEWPGANYRIVSQDYFRTLRIPVIQGRGFNEGDTAEAKDVVVINQALARRNFAGENPLGKRISFGTNAQDQPLWFEIVGVVADVRTMELTREPEPDFYATYRQVSAGEMSLVIRSAVDNASLAAAARNAVQSVDPALPVAAIRPLAQIVSESVAHPRFNLFLFGAFAGLALLLAAAGIYGVMSYAVTQRTREIGIRMALGAEPSAVLRMVVRQGMVLALIGIAVGAGAAFALTRLMTGLLYNVSATDPATFALIVPILAAVALIACAVPARRATKVDPTVALRYE